MTLLDTAQRPIYTGIARALQSLPQPMSIAVGSDSCVVKISDDWWCVVHPDDDREPGWEYDLLPDGDGWGASFETVGAALVVHYTLS